MHTTEESLENGLPERGNYVTLDPWVLQTWQEAHQVVHLVGEHAAHAKRTVHCLNS